MKKVCGANRSLHCFNGGMHAHLHTHVYMYSCRAEDEPVIANPEEAEAFRIQLEKVGAVAPGLTAKAYLSAFFHSYGHIYLRSTFNCIS